jgi:FtsH-binding integral membrane protein
MSRAARLQLIDILSRWASSGLAVVAGAVIFIAVNVGRAYPFHAAIWAAIVFAALYLCRRLQREFRAGAKSASRPFRWRSNYTAALSVLGAAFGSGAVIAVPDGAPPELGFQSLALLMGATLAASVLHAAHGRSAAAIFAPAGVFILLGAIRDVGPVTAFIWAGAVATTGAAALLLFHRFLRERAIRRFPRTGFVRRGAARLDEEAADFAAAAAARA